MRRPRRFDRRDTSEFGCRMVRTPRMAESAKRRVPSQERRRRTSRRAHLASPVPAAVAPAAAAGPPAGRSPAGGLVGGTRHSALPALDPRTRRHSIVPATDPLILDPIRSSARAQRIGVRASADRVLLAPVRAVRTVPERFADDRELVGIKLALLGAALVLAAFLG